MKIALYDIDSKIPNLALMKLSAWHKKQGDDVELYTPLKQYDKVYASQIFTDSTPQYHYDELGGSGTENFDIVLPEEVEHIMPDYELYPNMDYSLGFTTRGCIRKCPFCFVPKKEGMIKINADMYEFWNPKHKRIIFLDNNATAKPEHLKKTLEQVRKEDLTCEFNQGLDLRILTEDVAEDLKKTKLSELYFAWDNRVTESLIERGVKILHKVGLKTSRFYILVGFDSTFEDDLYRLNKIKEWNKKYDLHISPYCMRFKTVKGNKKYTQLSRWVNMPRFYFKMTFEEFKKAELKFKQDKREHYVDISKQDTLL